MEYEISLKEMAKAMHMGSSYLSALEYGERNLSQDHVERAVAFFATMARPEQLTEIRKAAAKSMDVMKISTTGAAEPDAQYYVAAFARRLQEGQQVPPEFKRWLETKH